MAIAGSSKLQLLCLVNTFLTPLELFTSYNLGLGLSEQTASPSTSAITSPYRIFTTNAASQTFFKKLLDKSTFKHGLGSVSLLAEVISEDKNNNEGKSRLCLFMYFHQLQEQQVLLCAVPLQMNSHLHEIVLKCSKLLLEHKEDSPMLDRERIKYLHGLKYEVRTANISAGDTSTETSVVNKKHNIINQVLKQKETNPNNDYSTLLRNAAAAAASLKKNTKVSNTSNSSIDISIQKAKANKLTIQRLVLSGLRLQGITKTSTEYKELYYHTFKSVEFAFRNYLKQQTLPPIDVLQDGVDTLLNLYLSSDDQNTGIKQ